MRKILPALIAFFIISAVNAQDNNGIKGITTTGIKGTRKSISDVRAQERPIPPGYKVLLRPELEGPRPKGQNPDAKPVSKFGTLVNKEVTNTSTLPTTPTQAVASNFLAIWGSYAKSGRESPYTPPDNCGDVGTTQIVATANCRMKVFTKPPLTGPASATPTGSSTATLNAVANIDLNVMAMVSH